MQILGSFYQICNDKCSYLNVPYTVSLYKPLSDLDPSTSVSNPFHFDTDSGPQIRFVEKRIRNWPKIEKY